MRSLVVQQTSQLTHLHFNICVKIMKSLSVLIILSTAVICVYSAVVKQGSTY